MQIDCTKDPCAAAKAAQTYCDDTGIPPSGPAIAFTGVGQQPGCGGDYCFDGAYLSGQGGSYCYCPKAMQQGLAAADASQGNFICACPQGTTPLGTSGGAEYTCMCPSGVPMNADGSCPPAPPAQAQAPVCQCPNNQVSSVSAGNACACGCAEGLTKSGDQCVAPCAQAGQIMLAGGSCCAAAQATSCGTCCPAGMRPDASGSSCVSASAVVPTRKPTTPSAPMRRL